MFSSKQCTTVNRVKLEYARHGIGEPVLLIHGALAEAFYPLVKDPMLPAWYELIDYSRRGWGNSERIGTIDIPTHAKDAVALLDRLGIERVHVVGHSYGPLIALEMALKYPERVHSLTLLETALPNVVLSSPDVAALAKQVYAFYQEANVEAAFDTFFNAFLGRDFRTVVERELPPHAITRAILDMPTLLENDFPALSSWSFGAEEAQRITQPTLLVLGENTTPLFQEAHGQMQQLLPHAQTFVLPAANHALHMVNAHDMARRLAEFFVQHPLEIYA